MSESPAAKPSPPPTPIPAPDDAREIVFVGGTFDPPHSAHITLPVEARNLSAPNAWLIYVPAAKSPHKSAGPIASDADRVAMLRLAIKDVPRSGVWTDELDRETPSYWVETLRRAKLLRPDARLRFIIGTDQALAFHRWHLAMEILKLAEPMVLCREPVASVASLAEKLESVRVENAPAWSAEAIARWVSWVAPVEPVAASSTDVRAGDSSALSPAVRAYIAEHGLYAETE